MDYCSYLSRLEFLEGTKGSDIVSSFLSVYREDVEPVQAFLFSLFEKLNLNNEGSKKEEKKYVFFTPPGMTGRVENSATEEFHSSSGATPVLLRVSFWLQWKQRLIISVRASPTPDEKSIAANDEVGLNEISYDKKGC